MSREYDQLPELPKLPEWFPEMAEEDLERFIEDTRAAVEDPEAGQHTFERALVQTSDLYQRYAQHHIRAANATQETAQRLERAIRGSSPASAVLELEKAYERATREHERKRDLSERLLELFEDTKERLRETVGPEQWDEILDRRERLANEYGDQMDEKQSEESESGWQAIKRMIGL